jgi:hypothetical protein
VKNGDMTSAFIHIDSYINEESKLPVYDILSTMCEQLKGRVTEIETDGITEDLIPNANAIIFVSNKLEVKELPKLAKMLETVMSKVEFTEASNGICYNDIVREGCSYRKIYRGEAYYKLVEICKETETEVIMKEEWKKALKEY